MNRAGWVSVRRIGAGLTVLAGLAAAGAGVLATVFTRKVVTPDHAKPDDVRVLAADPAAAPPTVTLARTPDTVVQGRYGLCWDEGRGAAQLGEVLAVDGSAVVRRLERVVAGRLRPGPARWNQYYFSGPPSQSLGLPHDDVEISTDVGPMPAWSVPASRSTGGTASVWAVMVHGRGASREECLRAIPSMHALGLPVLVPSYRNDLDVPGDPSGRYHLGDSEWEDVEAALRWALAAGAAQVVLFGWSMGGAIALQLISRSRLADRVRAVVLDAPVVDWHDVLAHHSRLNHVPGPVARLGHVLLRHRLGLRLVGLRRPLDLRQLDWVSRASELRLPILLIHSDDDEFVPNGPSLALGRARPDLVRVEPWRHGRHTKEWNTDPERWDRVVTRFVLDRL